MPHNIGGGYYSTHYYFVQGVHDNKLQRSPCSVGNKENITQHPNFNPPSKTFVNPTQCKSNHKKK